MVRTAVTGRDTSAWLRWPLLALAIAVITVTVLSGVPTNEGWARIWDFPRMQLAVLGAVLVVVLLLLRAWAWGWVAPAVIALLAAGVLYSVWRLAPYQPVWPTDIADAGQCPADARLSVLVANLLQSNDQHERALRVLSAASADVMVLLEVDDSWLAALRPLTDRYAHRVLEPRDNTYGMAVFSRLPLSDTRTLSTFGDDTPLVTGVLRMPDGKAVRLWAIHPRPPRPTQDTADRDAELLMTARKVRAQAGPAIIAGDLNDVVWSRTTTLLKDVSGTLDPRIGRSPVPTFNARWPAGLRWPLDDVFATRDFTLLGLRRLGRTGSDHFPYRVVLCLERPGAATPPVSEDAMERSREIVEEGRDD